ncbi:aspartate aminotransferase family protein [Streptomyces sp. HNM0574]|nr:aspartate aminotransferase family protein [Streptomyces sp. HNM0574]
MAAETGGDRYARATAGGVQGPEVLRDLTDVVIDALVQGALDRDGPLPSGGPAPAAARARAACAPVLPEQGVGAHDALRSLVRATARGSADPSDPYCAAGPYAPPLALAAAADLAASALAPVADCREEGPAAAVVEREVTEALATLVHPGRPAPGSVVTSGGDGANLAALLLARERARDTGARTVQVVCGTNAHRSVHRAAWTLGLPTPLTVECPRGRMQPAALDRVLAECGGVASVPVLVVATAGTEDAGLVDPLSELGQVAATHGATFHVDAAYGGTLLFSERLAPRLDGIQYAHSVALDLHRLGLGGQPVTAGALTVADGNTLGHLDPLDPVDPTCGSGLGSRSTGALKIAVTLRALGREGVAALVENCVDGADRLARAVEAHPALRAYPAAGTHGISTVLFRPLAADELPRGEGDLLVAAVRRKLLADGSAVLGRTVATDADGVDKLWLKATLLHPGTATPPEPHGLLKRIADTADSHGVATEAALHGRPVTLPAPAAADAAIAAHVRLHGAAA